MKVDGAEIKRPKSPPPKKKNKLIGQGNNRLVKVE